MTLPCVVPLCFIQRHACVLASTRPRLAPCNTRPSSSSLLDHIWRVEGDHAVVRRLRQQRLRHHVRRRAPRSGSVADMFTGTVTVTGPVTRAGLARKAAGWITVTIMTLVA